MVMLSYIPSFFEEKKEFQAKEIRHSPRETCNLYRGLVLSHLSHTLRLLLFIYFSKWVKGEGIRFLECYV